VAVCSSIVVSVRADQPGSPPLAAGDAVTGTPLRSVRVPWS
jgi:hypothetical protein